jgi:hypothetical protein
LRRIFLVKLMLSLLENMFSVGNDMEAFCRRNKFIKMMMTEKFQLSFDANHDNDKFV